MGTITFRKLEPGDMEIFNMLAGWFREEWKIPEEICIQNLQQVCADPEQLHVLMYLNGQPVSTGGLYHRVGLPNKEPRFRIYRNWLALIYTIPEYRGKGLGAGVCKYIEEQALEMGVKNLYLYTDTAERLYARLGWLVMERLQIDGRNLVVMEKAISTPVEH